MKRILEILTYATQVLAAITEGAKVASDKWPINNPFNSPKKDEEQKF